MRRSDRSCGAVYLAETTRSDAPGMYSAPSNTSGADGSCAAMLSNLAASRADTSCLASDADFDSCAKAVEAADAVRTTARKPEPSRGMWPSRGQRYAPLYTRRSCHTRAGFG